MIATIVQTHLLLRMLSTSLIAGVGVAVVFALAVFGLIRSGDMRRSGRPVAALSLGALGATGSVLTLALIVYGIILLARKS